MRNTDLLRQLGWSEMLISEMSSQAEQLDAIAQGTVAIQDDVGSQMTVTTSRVVYCSSGDGKQKFESTFEKI